MRRPFGKPAGSPPMSPSVLNFGDDVGVGGIEVFSRSMSAWIGPVKLVKPGMMPGGIPVSRMASRSARGLPDLTSAARLANGAAPGGMAG